MEENIDSRKGVTMYAQKVYGQLSLFGAEKSVDKNEYSQKMNNYSSEVAKQTEKTSKVISFADYFLPHANTDVKPQTENHTIKHTNKERSTKVFALRTQEEIYAMLREFNLAISNAKTPKKLKIAHRNRLVFVLGINLGLRASDLLERTWNDFIRSIDSDGNIVFNECFKLKPKKTKRFNKYVKVFINNIVKNTIREYVAQYPIYSLDERVFYSQKTVNSTDDDGINKSIDPRSLWRIMDKTAKKAGINQNIGTHTLRQTFGFWAWRNAQDKEKALITLQYIFGHASSATTMIYLGIMDIEAQQMFNVNLGDLSGKYNQLQAENQEKFEVVIEMDN